MTRERESLLRGLAQSIVGLSARPARVAVDGPDAAGKSTLADELAPAIESLRRPVIRASIDGFHRPRAERVARGFESPVGYYLDSFDYGALRRALLEPLGRDGDQTFRRAVFDHRMDEPVEAPVETASRDAVLLFDGVFLQRPEIADCWDFIIYVSVSPAETLRRASARDLHLFASERELRARYLARYIPGQELYRSAVRPRDAADVVVENEDPARPRLLARPD